MQHGLQVQNQLGQSQSQQQATADQGSLLGGMAGMAGVSGLGANSSGNTVYDNLLYSNLMLGNWLATIKTNNNSLYENMNGASLTDQMIHKNNLERYFQAEQQQRMLEISRGMPMQTEEQQSIISLMQQIGLYKELLSQVSYQNQLLSRDISARQPNAQIKMPSQLEQSQPGQGQFATGVQGMGNLMAMSGMQGMSNMGGMGGMASIMGNPSLVNQMAR